MDISETTAAKSDQLNAVDLVGKTMDITITNVSKGKTAEQPCDIHFSGSNKVWRPGKNMRRLLEHAWGKYTDKYVGKSLRLYTDEKVRYGADITGGIRISHMSHTEGFTKALPLSRGNIKAVTIKPLLSNETEALKVDEALVTAGQEAADKGLEAYTAWGKTLTEDQRSSVKHLLSAWLKTAKAVIQEEGVV